MTTTLNPAGDGGTPRQRARRQATDRKIASAVFLLVRRHGLAGVTIDRVAKESGVAATTIYRRYDDREDMLEAVARQLELPDFEQCAHTQEGLVHLLTQVISFYREEVGLSIIGAVLSLQGEDHATWRERAVTPVIERMRDFLDGAKEAGAIREDVDVDQSVELLLGGAFVAEVLRGEVDEAWVSDVVGRLWPLLAV